MTNYNQLASQRISFALSQAELAALLDIHPKILSKFELGTRLVNFHRALDLEAVFGLPPSALFPTEFEQRLEGVIDRATRLDEKIRERTDEGSRLKRVLLTRIIERARPTVEL